MTYLGTKGSGLAQMAYFSMCHPELPTASLGEPERMRDLLRRLRYTQKIYLISANVIPMVDFIRKRLQVFVSSTFNDLREERQAAVEAILAAGHIPAGMELFAAGDESQMEVIKQWIDESDVYLLILGGRYGSIDPRSAKSYTQLEYEYALSKGKPLFACVIKDAALEARVKKHGMEMLDKQRKEWDTFRELVQSKVVEFWDDSKDIKIAIANKLGQLSRREDLIGWVRAHQEANLPALSNEIARLSKENAELRSQLTNSEVIIHGLPYSKMKALLQKSGALDYLKANKEFLHRGMSSYEARNREHVDKLQTLIRFGIINERGSHYFFTDSGYVFLNNFEFEELSPTVPSK
jgi:nucleoside 2-deoxyribosyltransferase